MLFENYIKVDNFSGWNLKIFDYLLAKAELILNETNAMSDI